MNHRDLRARWPEEITAGIYAFAWRPIAPCGLSQNLTWWVRWKQALVVVKCRKPAFYRGLVKEANGIGLARSLAIHTPIAVAHLESDKVCALILRPLFTPFSFSSSFTSSPTPSIITPAARHAHRRHILRPQELMTRLAPLHQAPCPTGWGPLRADGAARWREPETALKWYESLINQLPSSVSDSCRTMLRQTLLSTWPHRIHGLIHGDLHRHNLWRSVIMDWEQLAVGDPFEDLARLALAHRIAQPWRHLGAHPDQPRWQGAVARSLIESASYPGLRQQRALTILNHGPCHQATLGQGLCSFA